MVTRQADHERVRVEVDYVLLREERQILRCVDVDAEVERLSAKVNDELRRSGLNSDAVSVSDKVAEGVRALRRSKGVSSVELRVMTGVQFENWLEEQIQSAGFRVRPTRVTGDQGADLLVEVPVGLMVVQAKRYGRPVGNGAVQEVYAAKGFYRAKKAAVVTNSTFTKSARELAQRLNVELVEGKEVQRVVELLCRGT